MARTYRRPGKRQGQTAYTPSYRPNRQGLARDGRVFTWPGKRLLRQAGTEVRNDWDDCLGSSRERGRARRAADRHAIREGVRDWEDAV